MKDIPLNLFPIYGEHMRHVEEEYIKKQMEEDHDEWDIPAKVIGKVKGKFMPFQTTLGEILQLDNRNDYGTDRDSTNTRTRKEGRGSRQADNSSQVSDRARQNGS